MCFTAMASNEQRVSSFSKNELSCKEQRALEEKNKEFVLKGYQELYGDHKIDQISKYIHEDYIDHNPDAEEDGLKGAIKYANKWAEMAPKQKLDFKRVSAEGDLVWTHLRAKGPGGTDLAVMDVFRMKDGKMAEHWDVIQVIDGSSKNVHPFF